MSNVSSSYPVRFAQLAAIWAYAVSQPVFSLLEGNPEFLVVRGSTRAEVVVFALVLALGPAAAALACEWIVSRASRKASAALHVSFLGLFAAPLGLLLLQSIDASAAIAVGGSLAVGAALIAAYLRWRYLRLFLGLSFVLPLIGLVSFVLGTRLVTEDAEGARVRIARSTPVVVVVFDELPVSSLMTADGALDVVRYPSFGRLASSATWYPRATTVADHTTGAVPAILTGRLPREGAIPTVEDHPRNLFTLLGERYRMLVQEEVTYLCPKRYCPRPRGGFLGRLSGLFGDVRVAYLQSVLPRSLAKGLPSIDDRWSGFKNTNRLLAADDPTELADIVLNRSRSIQQRVDAFVSGFQPGERARTVHFAHFALPHGPWRFLPSGREYPIVASSDRAIRRGGVWADDPWLVLREYQQHLLHVGYADTVLGRILDRMDQTGVYDRALVVIAADHGVSFVSGASRRFVTRENVADVARVPLFVKLPGQTRGRVDRSPVRTVDVMPTIADVLGLDGAQPFDGRSLLDAGRGATEVTVDGDPGPVRVSLAELDRRQARTLRHKASHFGQGADSHFAIGIHRSLVGRSLQDIRVRTPGSGRIDFDGEALLRDVRPWSAFVPALISGTIEGVELEPDVELALALNGRVAVLTHPFRIEGRQRFAAMVPESAFRRGLNIVEVLSISGTPPMLELTRLGSSAASR